MIVLVYVVLLPITDCAVLVLINLAGPVHTVFTVTGISTAELNLTVQVRLGEDPANTGTMEGVTVTVIGAGTR